MQTKSYTEHDIWRVRPDGSGLENLTEGLDGYVEAPSVSLNAKKVAFTMGTQATSDVWVMDANGSDPKQVTTSPPSNPLAGLDQMPAISPDGETIAFMSTRDTPPDASGLDHDIYTVSSDGGAVSHLINRTSEEYNPDFSPDGQTVVLQGEVSGPYDIVKVPLAGAPHTNYTSITLARVSKSGFRASRPTERKSFSISAPRTSRRWESTAARSLRS